MVNLIIDGIQVQVPEGTTVLRAAEQAGIFIPSLCDHPMLTPLGHCRLCLVEAGEGGVPRTACTLHVSEGLQVRTDTPRVREERMVSLRRIFDERNHDCPACPANGACALQDTAAALGLTEWPLRPERRPFAVDDSHALITLDQNTCILCGRCVRACGDLVGNHTLSIEKRGDETLLLADGDLPLGESSCISCGACVQACPTGALRSPLSTLPGFKSRLGDVASVCVGCSVGCSTRVLSRANRVVRIEGDPGGKVNRGLMCREGRFRPLEENRDRVTTPMVRYRGTLTDVSWEEALAVVSGYLKPLGYRNSRAVAALASTRLPAEALSLFTEIFNEGLYCDMVTSIEEGFPTRQPTRLAERLGRPFEGRLAELEHIESVLTLSVDLAQEHMVAGFFLRRGLSAGWLRMVAMNAQPAGLDERADTFIRAEEEQYLPILHGLRAALILAGMNRGDAPDMDAGDELRKAARASRLPVELFLKAAYLIGSGSRPVIVFGKNLACGSDLDTLQELVELADTAGAALINVKGRANSQAAAQYGLDKVFDPAGRAAAYVAMGDDRVSQRLVNRLERVPFLAVQASYHSALTARANVILPVEIWSEQEGHYLNLGGRLQKTSRIVEPPGRVHSNTAVLKDLALALGLSPNFDWKGRLLRRVSAVTIFEE